MQYQRICVCHIRKMHGVEIVAAYGVYQWFRSFKEQGVDSEQDAADDLKKFHDRLIFESISLRSVREGTIGRQNDLLTA